MTTIDRRIYNPLSLTEEEQRRFLAALGDGYYGFSGRDTVAEELPPEVNQGLLQHRAYYDRTWLEQESRLSHDSTSARATDNKFWYPNGPDFPRPHFALNPIQFGFEAIKSYFETQKNSYLESIVSEDGKIHGRKKHPHDIEWDSLLYSTAVKELYTKAWYEYHINAEIENVKKAERLVRIEAEQGSISYGMAIWMIVMAAGTLGRLVEQYYWKFMVEKAAERGIKTAEAASAGGKTRAANRKMEQWEWNKAAKHVWKEHPNLNKTAVARAVAKRLAVKLSPRHIAKYISKPK